MNILVLGGGDSTEREVSLRSAVGVRQALEELGHRVGFFDPQGRWDHLVKAAGDYELVIPVLHGTGGEDGRVQELLDRSGVPYLGSGTATSQLCFDKGRTREKLSENGIKVPAGEIVTAASFARSPLIKAPFVLKPVADGSSVGVMIARKLPYDKSQVKELFAAYDEMLIEELIVGVEITVPVLDQTALPVIEIVPPKGEEFDYDNKYNGDTAELCPAKHVDGATQEAAQRLAERIHRLMGARHLSRTDMIVTPAGELVVLEINTMPGMTDQSLYPKAAAAAGLPWKKLVARLVELAKP